MAISTAIDQSAVARVVGIKTAFVNLQGGIFLLPQRLAIVGQGSTSSVYSTDKRQITSASEAGSLYGYGSPIHLSALQLFPTIGDGVGTIPVTIYPLEDENLSVASTGDIIPSGSQTAIAAYKVVISNIESSQFVINIGDSVAVIVASMVEAINSNINMPVIAVDGTTDVTLTSKWKGLSANNMKVEVVGSTTAGTSFAITQMSGGLINPNIDDALLQFSNVWETIVLNCLDLQDTTTLDKYNVFGEGRWGALVKKPLVVFTGTNLTTVNDATTISDARKTDRVNVQLVLPGSKELAFVIAARQLVKIIKTANNNPARDYGSQKATGLIPGSDSVQWNYIDRNTAVSKGSSTIEVKDSVVNLSDIVTFYHPTGEPIPAYRYVCDIIKVQNIIFNLDLIFNTERWDGAPLIPNDQPTVNPDAVTPKMAIAEIRNMLDSLNLNAITSEDSDHKAIILAEISALNPKRLDIATTLRISGNANIISIDLNFGFYFGTPTVL